MKMVSAVAGVVLVVGYPGGCLAQQLRQRALPLLDRRPAQILSVQLQEIERA